MPDESLISESMLDNVPELSKQEAVGLAKTILTEDRDFIRQLGSDQKADFTKGSLMSQIITRIGDLLDESERARMIDANLKKAKDLDSALEEMAKGNNLPAARELCSQALESLRLAHITQRRLDIGSTSHSPDIFIKDRNNALDLAGRYVGIAKALGK